MKSGIYIYGFIKAGSEQEFGNTGIGEQSTRVTTLAFKDIAAVVSESPFTIYDSLAKEKTVRDLVAHQFVLEKVMARFTVLPAKFGTMVEHVVEVITFLEKGYALLSDELDKMAENIELDVVAQWELPKVMAAIFRDSPDIQRKQREFALKGSQVAVEEKVTLGQQVAELLQTRKASSTQLILQALKEEAVDFCLHDVANDEMILNAAFLLQKKHEEAFNEAVARLDQKLENAVNFRVVGPLPPYSFATILLENIAPIKVEEARKTLGLHSEITDKAVRDAYRQLAQKSHPDTGGGANVQDFSRLHDAYRTLKNVAEHGMTRVEVHHWEKDLL
jgi:DnaJ-domain-containing protein 1